jgi:hypothetical protein
MNEKNAKKSIMTEQVTSVVLPNMFLLLQMIREGGGGQLTRPSLFGIPLIKMALGSINFF